MLRLSEAQVWRHTAAWLGLALRLLDLFTPIDFPQSIYQSLNYRAVPRQARFRDSNVRDARAPRGWCPVPAFG